MGNPQEAQEARIVDTETVYVVDTSRSQLTDLGAWFPLTSPRRLLVLADELPPLAFAAFVIGESLLLGVAVGLGASVVHRAYHLLGWAT